jgi:multisubunit Na+/H+ antiporter MnhG subunit
MRRRAVFGSLLFGMVVIGYVMFRWDDTTLAETLVLASFGLIGAVVAAYIGGAAYEDVRLFKPVRERRYAEEDGEIPLDEDENV